MNRKRITLVIQAAGIFNIGAVPIFSMLFTNPYPAKYYPAVFSDFGCIVIILWGLAYLSVSDVYMHNRALMMVFALEKMVYAATWIYFLVNMGNMLPEIFNESLITGIMFSSYGLIDIIFGLFFAWVSIRGYRIRE